MAGEMNCKCENCGHYFQYCTCRPIEEKFENSADRGTCLWCKQPLVGSKSEERGVCDECAPLYNWEKIES